VIGRHAGLIGIPVAKVTEIGRIIDPIDRKQLITWGRQPAHDGPWVRGSRRAMHQRS
jgi:hypothetical protein